MKILVTGGAGYIGSVAVKELISRGYEVVVVDNLSKGSQKLVDGSARFYAIDLTDKDSLSKVFTENRIDAVMHFAAYKAVEESMFDAVKYSDNIKATLNILDLMVENSVKKMIYSSSAAVYGMPDETLIDEDCPLDPINYYGFTKLECERLIQWYSRIYDIGYISFRYFNVAGDAGLGYIDPAAENIFPIIMEVLSGKRDKLKIFGNDYETRDGTCVRDYVHVTDLVDAHIKGLDCEEDAVINLGSSNGVTVKELVDETMAVTGKEFEFEFAPRRKGDPAALVASNSKALKLLGWKPQKSLKDMIKSTYDAYLS